MSVYHKPPSDVYCPYWRKPMSKCCPQCVKWVGLMGANPNTGEPMQGYQCSDVAQLFATLEVSQQVRQNGAATESMRNEIVNRMDHVRPLSYPAGSGQKMLNGTKSDDH